MYKLCVFIPESHLDAVKSAILNAGAGRIGNYDYCCWQTAGEGQFRPLGGSHPHLGALGEVEMVKEYKVECVCDETVMASVIMALKSSHPYEEPAYEVYRLEAF